MAKWGEGDPRWIVEERPDATNVNNWHWTEKNATPWSKDRIRKLLTDFEIKDNNIECKITEIEKVDGEATANNRKGKLIFFYEWNVSLKWNGYLPGQEKPCEGKIIIPNLSEENDLDDVQIDITMNESTDESHKLKQFMYNVGRDHIRKQLGIYLKELREEFSKGLILPKKDDIINQNNTLKSDGVANMSNAFNKKINMQPIVSTDNKSLGCKIAVTTIAVSENFQCRSNEIYDAWTKQEMVCAFTRGPCKLEAKKGGIFELFGGNITGKFEELIPNKKIVQSWRYSQWPSGHFSNVVIEFDEKGDHTEVKITQSGVPESEKDATLKNWRGYYINSIKQTFGFGNFLM
ncbi:activator of 90 kDa heat shock protein ATPase homolog 1 [Bradysia coprophila]|uniref:activator of 90 kDa heat shock protein ATPase homolog 1 n=1 Tax=Bradysia coprophila TaxID=38358 RepID=UPI00187DB1DE|nr:activator of 90 kDa heat shock protein ATPase homolog 1 [Bradysia coprophila]XP_037036093.1 activator of 90 kDa heat shock protein ATPase homolog 1 [Bradysia coprophila]